MPLFELRPWQMEDAPSLAAQANNWNIARFMTNAFPHPYTLENAHAFIDMASQTNTIFAIVVEGKAVGGIGLYLQKDILCKNAELGYWLGEAYWGRGVVTQAIGQVVEYGFAHFDLLRIYARPFGNNLASQRVLTKAGFTLEARIHQNLFKNGELLDELIYAVRRK